MTNPNNVAPSDLEDFQKAVGAVLVQLAHGWPTPTDLDRGAVARTLARTEDLSNEKLPSGTLLDEFLDQTITWLRDEGLISCRGASPWDEVALSGKSTLALHMTRRGSDVMFIESLSEAVSTGTWCWYELDEFFQGLLSGSILLRRSMERPNSAYKLRAAP
jgi:hypothetical protein